MTTTRPPPKATPSGQHPAVREYRAKLESIAEGDEVRKNLDRQLDEYLQELRTPLPPKPA